MAEDGLSDDASIVSGDDDQQDVDGAQYAGELSKIVVAHIQRIISPGYAKVAPRLKATDLLSPEGVGIANALLAVLWSSIPSLSKGDAMTEDEHQNIIANWNTYTQMNFILSKLMDEAFSMNERVCDFFNEFVTCYDKGETLVGELNNFYNDINQLNQYKESDLTIVPDPKGMHDLRDALDAYKSVTKLSQMVQDEITNPLQSDQDLEESLAPKFIELKNIEFKNYIKLATPDHTIRAYLEIIMTIGASALCASATWRLFSGVVYQAKINDGHGKVVVDQGVWEPDLALVIAVVSVSAALSQWMTSTRLGVLSAQLTQEDVSKFCVNMASHLKDAAMNAFNPAEVIALQSSITYINARILRATQDWQRLFKNPESLVDADYNVPNIKMYRAVLTAVTAALYGAAAYAGMFNDQAILDALFLVLSPFILAPTIQVVVSHVLESLKHWVETAARSPSGELTFIRSRRITGLALWLAGSITVMAYALPNNVYSTNPVYHAFMSTDTENYHEMMGFLGPICFFSCALFVSVLLSGLGSSWGCSLREPSEQGSAFFEFMLSILKFSGLYALLYSLMTVVMGEYCSHDPFLPGECVSAVDKSSGLTGGYTQVTVTSAFFIKEAFALTQFAFADSPKMAAYLWAVLSCGHKGSDRLAAGLWLLSRPSSLVVESLYQICAYLKEAVSPELVAGPLNSKLSFELWATSQSDDAQPGGDNSCDSDSSVVSRPTV